MTTGSASRARFLVVAWSQFQARTTALGPALGGESYHIHGHWPGRHLALLPLRYAANAVRMWRLLRQHRPQVLVVVTPPVVAPAVASLWCLLHRCQLVVDCHTAVFHWWKWRWTVPLHWLLFRRAQAALVHTEEDRSLVRKWGVPAVLLPDDLPVPSQALPIPRPESTLRVVVAGSLDRDEPVATVLVAAAMLSDVEIRLTGDPRKLPEPVRSGAPANAVFTGYLPYGQFLGELMAADVIAVFSTDATAMNRAAFEAIGLGRPLILSDVAGLRARFEEAGLFCANEPAAMAQAIRQAQRERSTLADRSVALRQRLQAQREVGLAQLRSILQESQPAPTATARARSHP